MSLKHPPPGSGSGGPGAGSAAVAAVPRDGMDNSDITMDTEVQRLLSDAGLESFPVDPASLQALQEFVAVQEQRQQNADAVPELVSDNSDGVSMFLNNNNNNNARETKKNIFPSVTSAPKPPPPQHPSSSDPEVRTTTAAPADSTPRDGTAASIPNGFLQGGSHFNDPTSSAALPSAAAGSLSSPWSSCAAARMRMSSPTLDGVENIFSNNRAIDAATRDIGGAKTTMEERIVRHLQQQTAMIHELQQRVDELTLAVQRNMLSAAATTVPAGANTAAAAATTGGRQLPATIAPRQHQQAAAAVDPADAPAAAPRGGVWGLIRYIGNAPTAIQSSRLVQIIKLFFVLRKRHVPNLDFGLLFKALIMLAILGSRLSSSRTSRRHKDDLQQVPWTYKFGAFAFFIVGGLLVQTGYANFLYHFFVKANYPGRIWNGEVIDPEREAARPLAEAAAAAAAAQPANAAAGGGAPQANMGQQEQQNPPEGGGGNNNNNNNNANNDVGPPRPPGAPRAPGAGGAAAANDDGDDCFRTFFGGFLGGRIQPNEPDDNIVLRVVQDIVCVFGSFLLSIFPMWRPEGPPPPPPQEQQGEQEPEPEPEFPEPEPAPE